MAKIRRRPNVGFGQLDPFGNNIFAFTISVQSYPCNQDAQDICSRTLYRQKIGAFVRSGRTTTTIGTLRLRGSVPGPRKSLVRHFSPLLPRKRSVPVATSFR